MSSLEDDLLAAIPASARQILVIGKDLLAHRSLWEMRNPLLAVETAVGPWTRPIQAEKARRTEAAILSLNELGEDAPLAVSRAANCLVPGATLALFAAVPATAAAFAALSAMLAERGLVPERRFGTAASPHQILRFHSAQEPLRPLCITARTIDSRSGVLGTAAANVRIVQPFKQLDSLPGVHCNASSNDDTMPQTREGFGNIFIIQRIYFTRPELNVSVYARSHLALFEVDDLLSISEDILRKNLPAYHAIQTSTPYLADYLRQFNPIVGVFPNQLIRARPYQPRPPRGEIRIVFAAINREAGWQDFIQAYQDVVSPFGDRVHTVVVGDRKFHDALPTLKRSFHPVLAYPDYVKVLDASDIALLPLSDRPFDRSKTDLKFLECAESGAAVLASHTVYGETVKPGKTGFVYRNVEEFRRHLLTLIQETGTRERVARHANRYVREQRMLANHISDRYRWYQSLVERKEELERLRLQRIG